MKLLKAALWTVMKQSICGSVELLTVDWHGLSSSTSTTPLVLCYSITSQNTAPVL